MRMMTVQPSFHKDTLTDNGRVFQYATKGWLKSIKLGLDAGRDGHDIDSLANALNNLALLNLRFNKSEMAVCICDLEIAIAKCLNGSSDNYSICMLAFQPWINLGRLYRRSGCMADSIHHMKTTLEALLYRKEVPYWKEFYARDPKFIQMALLISVVEYVKSLAAAGLFEEALMVLTNFDRRKIPEHSLLLLDELQVSVNISKGDISSAAEILKSDSWRGNHVSLIVRQFYLAALFLYLDKHDDSIDCINCSKILSLCDGDFRNCDHNVIRIMEAHIQLYLRMGDIISARIIALKLCEILSVKEDLIYINKVMAVGDKLTLEMTKLSELNSLEDYEKDNNRILLDQVNEVANMVAKGLGVVCAVR